MPRPISRRDLLKTASAATLGLGATRLLHAAPETKRPNILWIIAEDMCPWMSCYGDKLLKTPTFDAIAAAGVRFDRAYVPAPVCSPHLPLPLLLPTAPAYCHCCCLLLTFVPNRTLIIPADLL